MIGPVNFAPFDAQGWSPSAIRREMHQIRIGPPRTLRAVVVHTTDMSPRSFDALVKSWTTTPGECARRGVGAHFLIGRTPEQGVVQLASVLNKTAHAGGKSAGYWLLHDPAEEQGSSINPNDIAVGIEVHNAGELRRVNGRWCQVERINGKPVAGKWTCPDEDVEVDSRLPTRGWHKTTQYQLEVLGPLLQMLDRTMPPLPIGSIARPRTGECALWQQTQSARVVGHCSLDPTRKSDPWPPLMRWLADQGW
ncbi:MAG: N-acetylmuramoyl-L-alanine amidase [Desulfurellales bacterium]|nr:MAG: N-acetylmuramoyl-L-alanine amidase [Desulfurellales bacterium]